ncbi:5'-nucleotidase [Holothuria leucospilota]|uniref:5'-nucleotidase n=1 Tax=Holothuria leucospilota TaxID=206669 RepID=A0A9Q1BMX9_HOLLE|nr:5'-nucleotidase [Holothuria leucospilota]
MSIFTSISVLGIVAWILSFPYVALSNWHLIVLHTNDIHARFDEVGPNGIGPCTEELKNDDDCFGGIARLISATNAARAGEENVILLNAGDILQGPLWYDVYQGSLTSRFMNMMSYNVTAIGQHEFDFGVEKLTEFVQNLTFPSLACNIDGSAEPEFAAVIGCSQILTVDGERVGVVGFTDESYANFSQTGDLVIGSIVEYLQEEVIRLMEEENVTKIIAVGHTSINNAMTIARTVRGLDLVVTGGSAVFLYTGESPDEVIEPTGEYPIVIRPDYDPDRMVLLVSVFPFGKYLGRINVTFDDITGEVLSYEGNPILLDSSVDQDEDILEELDAYRGPVDTLAKKKVGYSLVPLDGSFEICGRQECNMGNSFADSFFNYVLSNESFPYWGDVNFAVTNGGGFVGSFQRGDLTFGDLSYIIPFGDTLHVIEMKGEHVLEMLEFSVAGLEPGVSRYEFLQTAGLRLTYDLTKRPGNRLVSASALCTSCEIPRFLPINVDTVYTFVTNSYIASGGEGYAVIPENLISRIKGPSDKDVWAAYFSETSPIWTGVEGRTTFTKPAGACAKPRPGSIAAFLCQLL